MMARKEYVWKHCEDCGRGFGARGYPRQLKAWRYCERCVSRRVETPHTVTFTERDVRGKVLGVTTLQLGT